MNVEHWIVIPGWEKFQHYRDRDPVWIKLYTSLNSDDQWLGLTRAARGLLVTIWVEYARSHASLKAKNAIALCDAGARGAHLKPLIDAGFIRLSASKPPRPAASPEKEKEKNKNYARARGAVDKPPSRASQKELLARFDKWVEFEGYEYVNFPDEFADELRRRKFIPDVKSPLAGELLDRARAQVQH